MSENELQLHRKLAAETFNQVWDLMDKQDRTEYETIKMIHLAHASVHHWSFVGEAVNMARGEWQVSRAYCVARMPESALFHARWSLEICENAKIGGFDLAFGYEAVARAQALAGNAEEAKKHVELGREAAEGIQEQNDKEYFLGELNNILV
ncbi:MAG: hypothetical protein GX171_00330 [Clostridiales bacterium]|jgi:hypothetical protein|nr:hypothetical protein [Clostridiales bacterium]